MSLVLDGASFLWASSPKTSYPFSISVWFKTSDVTQGTANAALVSIGQGNSSAEDTNLAMLAGATANAPIHARSQEGTWGIAESVSPFPQNDTWHHGAFVFTSNVKREVWLDGASYAIDTTDRDAITSIDLITLGVRVKNVPSLYFTGQLSRLYFYDVALTSAEVGSLYQGNVRWTDLLDYWVLHGDARSGLTGTVLTASGSPTYDLNDNPVFDELRRGRRGQRRSDGV